MKAGGTEEHTLLSQMPPHPVQSKTKFTYILIKYFNTYTDTNQDVNQDEKGKHACSTLIKFYQVGIISTQNKQSKVHVLNILLRGFWL